MKNIPNRFSYTSNGELVPTIFIYFTLTFSTRDAVWIHGAGHERR